MTCMDNIEKNSPFTQKYVESLHTECYTMDCKWINFGSVFHGITNNKNNKFLSISADGSILAIGNYGIYNETGIVQIHEYKKEGKWIQRGKSITGENTGDRFGWSVSLSADGSSVAVGVPYSDANGFDSGHVSMYMYNETDGRWFPRGNNIKGTQTNSLFGWTVSLSADGIVVGISVRHTEGTECYVRVFEYDELKDKWIQRGDCLDGEENVQLDTYVKLSSTGSIVAISASYNNEDGFVKVFEYNAFEIKWKQLGDTFVGEGYSHALGWSMGISSDGSVLAFGGTDARPVIIYKYNKNHNSKWQEIGEPIEADAGMYYELSLSSSGSILVVSSNNLVRVLSYDELTNQWLDSSANFPAMNYTNGTYPMIASSADAVTVAAYTNDKIDVYRLEIKAGYSTICEGNEFFFNFTIQPDNFPEDITWLLEDNRNKRIMGGRLPNEQTNEGSPQQLVYTRCLKNNNTFYFSIEDDYEDGICCDWGDGIFTLEWNDEQVLNSVNFKTKKEMCLPPNSTDCLSVNVFN
eukprot:CAMPEP_0197823816 /NCGR_PEP_ID=MMETSP1437-20131217/1127_1 /TAXON_ID=49252 ORGANISM="Eucampia antarctica, Strain CCMP1452" /NCGR_SAMPLE_ID=MMETSP1437 /ASSEMBLY_ACC=CAM_ASM_001096 /LENGTH=521 /DNA_ID=CAMNT_0043423163 /DNA_START=211 /DNA_END=1776 /DNA_ORIENTATION=-